MMKSLPKKFYTVAKQFNDSVALFALNKILGLHKEQHLRPKRIKRPCPLPGCQSKRSFVRLANHIRDFHKIKDIAERKMWLAKAKRNVR